MRLASSGPVLLLMHALFNCPYIVVSAVAVVIVIVFFAGAPSGGSRCSLLLQLLRARVFLQPFLHKTLATLSWGRSP